MKKLFLILALAITSMLGVSAQEPADGAFGVRVSWDLNSPSTNIPGMGNGSGLSVGAIYDIPLYQGLYFEPGLSFFYNTMDVSGYNINNVDQELLGKSGTLRNTGFRIPLIFGYRIGLLDDIAISVFTGPQVNVGLSMSEHYEHYKSGSQYGNGYNRLDAQWLFGVKMYYQDNFFAEIGGGIGMSNLVDKDNIAYKGKHLRRNIFSIGVGYMF